MSRTTASLLTSGWLMSLSDQPESSWGGVESFFKEVAAAPTRKGRHIVDGYVWGRVGTKEILPAAGQGIAFYHSSRAHFPPHDRYARKPRVSLVAELLKVEAEDRQVSYIRFAVARSVATEMEKHPIVREGAMVKVFEDCGIKQGSVATYYYAAPPNWRKIMARSVGPSP